MTVSFPGRWVTSAAVAAVLTVVLALSASDTAYATYDPELSVAVADTTAEATSDITVQFDLPNGDANFSGAVRFMPGDWGIVDGRDIPIGAEVASVFADATLGLLNGACNQSIPVEFAMKNASLDKTDTVPFDDQNGNLTFDFAEDRNFNGLIDGIDRWPDFLSRIFVAPAAEPIRRSAGNTVVAGVPVLLQFVTFPPGTAIFEDIPSDPALGYPTVVLLSNWGDPLASPVPIAITDFCTPLGVDMTFFGLSRDNPDTWGVDEGGMPLFVNPQDGTYSIAVASSGRRDADGDGYENALDTCPLVPNAGNPRAAASGDSDFDGLDAACDPNDNPLTLGTDTDQDDDGYLNRQDNCPLIPNGEFGANQSDIDVDQIGDACDPNPTNADTEGALTLDQSSVEVTIGTGAGPGGPPDCPVPGCWSPPEPVAADARGNVDCDDDIDANDVLMELQHVGGLPSSQEPGCPAIGSTGSARAAGVSTDVVGDIDCDGDVDAVDPLIILRFVAGFPVDLPPGCDPLGS